MSLGSDLISLSATVSLFHNVGPLNFCVCCGRFILQYCGHNLDLDRVRRMAFSLRKLESKMFEKIERYTGWSKSRWTVKNFYLKITRLLTKDKIKDQTK